MTISRFDVEKPLVEEDSEDGPPTAISFMGSPFTTRGWVRTGFSY